MRTYYYQFSIESENPHYFNEFDVGNEFVRTLPCAMPYGKDWSYTSEGSTESKIRKSAMRLTSLGEEYLYFVTKNRYTSALENVQLSRGRWDDGNWISIAECIQQLSKTKPEPNACQHSGSI